MLETLMARLLFLTVFLLSACSCDAQDWKGRENAVRLEFEQGICSGTVIGNHSVVSASHCFKGIGKLKKIDDRPVASVIEMQDGNDHSIIVVDLTFKTHALWGAIPYPGERIHLWGQVAGLHFMFRTGYIAGQEGGTWLSTLNSYHGDSGAGVLNDAGQLIGVDSGAGQWQEDGDPTIFTLAYMNPLSFTLAQLKAIR